MKFIPFFALNYTHVTRIVKIVKSDGFKSAYVYLVKKNVFNAFIHYQNKLKYNYTVNFFNVINCKLANEIGA